MTTSARLLLAALVATALVASGGAARQVAGVRKDAKGASVGKGGDFGRADEAADRVSRPFKSLDGGWGDSIPWVQTYEEGLKMAAEQGKPLMVIHWSEACPYCIALREAFKNHGEVQRMAAEDFVSVNLQTETLDQNLAPDGRYVPRIMFVDPSMTVRADIGSGYRNSLYAYHSDEVFRLVDAMKKAKVPLKTEL
uniref:Anterior gradient protein 3-like n=2 Tax=Petromyzon marinus TaxID=7757 RepID=A0AAJ7SXP8_PETMA|nr:anterior gradient protein 3-like [Petromyzon marinus]